MGWEAPDLRMKAWQVILSQWLVLGLIFGPGIGYLVVHLVRVILWP